MDGKWGAYTMQQALRNNAPLGSIKLLMEAAAIAVDHKGVFLLHLACEFSSKSVVHYLMGDLMIEVRLWKTSVIQMHVVEATWE